MGAHGVREPHQGIREVSDEPLKGAVESGGYRIDSRVIRAVLEAARELERRRDEETEEDGS